MLFSLNTFPV